MHPTLLGILLGASFVLQSCETAATITAENVAAGSDAEVEQMGATPEWGSDMELLTGYLEQLLRDGELWDAHEAPLLYVEDADEDAEALPVPWKRSRYYRRYPWKRQNGRHRAQYADANRYMCNPTREDVFQLLVALHEAREGNTRRTVNFCNRKRPASTIFTNIRFLGRRK
ncbi:uncharacterized protein [Periplaneta americana]|uniref:uncharacterized protein n=1 Tax=Periplaneta americana TaxID=6978 RepID=UPI0037E7DDE2